jgi:hypothetical protein
MAGMHRGATAEARAAVRQDRIGDAAAGEHRTWTDRAAADVSLTPIFVKTGPLPRPKVGGVRPGFGPGTTAPMPPSIGFTGPPRTGGRQRQPKHRSMTGGLITGGGSIFTTRGGGVSITTGGGLKTRVGGLLTTGGRSGGLLSTRGGSFGGMVMGGDEQTLEFPRVRFGAAKHTRSYVL